MTGARWLTGLGPRLSTQPSEPLDQLLSKTYSPIPTGTPPTPHHSQVPDRLVDPSALVSDAAPRLTPCQMATTPPAINTSPMISPETSGVSSLVRRADVADWLRAPILTTLRHPRHRVFVVACVSNVRPQAGQVNSMPIIALVDKVKRYRHRCPRVMAIDRRPRVDSCQRGIH
jgi:hypothetical protein